MTIFVSSCSLTEFGVAGRFGVSPSQSQQRRPCAAAASCSCFCSAVGMLREVAAAGVELTADEIRERMNGNLCRCGAYANIVPAILDAGG